jgi:hypothetical protein
LLVHKLGRYRVREVGQKDRETTSIGPLFAHSSGAPNDKIVYFFGFDSCSFGHLGKQLGQKFIGSHFAKYISGRIFGP